MSMFSQLVRGKKRRTPTAVAPIAPPTDPMFDRNALVRTQGEQMQKAFDYDPTPAVNRYAQGAWGSISNRIGTQLRDLSGRAVGQGRFDSGFYDEDQGDIMLAGMEEFGNTMARTSMDAERMRLGEMGEGREMLMSRREELENVSREEQERKRKKKKGLWGAIGGALGAGAGAFFGQPGIGYRIGSALGGR